MKTIKTSNGRAAPKETSEGAGALRRIVELSHTLQREEALWLSGYLAGLGSGGQTAEVLEPVGETSPAESPSIALTVLYATETGNSREVAERLAALAGGRGVTARAVDAAEYRTRDLAGERHLALVAATHGEGDPPEPAIGFFEYLWSRRAPRLEDTRFSVLALGDSSYVEFCKAGRDLDERLEELGAQRILELVTCDVDYEEDADGWIERLLDALAREADGRDGPGGSGGSDAPTVGASGNGSAAPRASGVWDVAARVLGAPAPSVNGSAAHTRTQPTARNPYCAEILDTTPLTGLRSSKDTRHFEIAFEEGALSFEPGDSLGIVPENEPEVVASVVDALEVEPDEAVRIGEEERSLGEALTRDLELTRVTVSFLESYAELSASRELERLLSPEHRGELRHFVRCHQIPDILRLYPVRGLDPQQLVDMLRRLQPRLYSIASSEKWSPGQLDLTVGVTRFTADGKPRNGVASTYLADRRMPGEAVDVYVDRNSGFKLPEDSDAPIIMVGAGTGVAPFRAFLQERAEVGAAGKNWLFFGERSFQEDFLYQLEWQRFLKDGVLHRMDVAFSRDQADKVYVQHRIREQAEEVYEWLEDGAYLYVCGDAEGMAPGVEAALHQVVHTHGGGSAERAEHYLSEMRSTGRYQKDVY